MENELKPCPFCGGEPQCSGFEKDYPLQYCQIYVKCNNCGAEIHIEGRTLIAKRLKQIVIKAWNRRTELENNPLTLEQLKRMGGKPVYCIGLKNKAFDGWGLVSPANEEIIDSVCDMWLFQDYEKEYVAYAHKPEEPNEK